MDAEIVIRPQYPSADTVVIEADKWQKTVVLRSEGVTEHGLPEFIVHISVNDVDVLIAALRRAAELLKE